MTTPHPQHQTPGYYNAPHDTQAISIGSNFPATGAIYPPGKHPRIKSLLSLTLGSAALFILGQILSFFSPQETVGVNFSMNTDTAAVQTSRMVAAGLGVLLLAGLYFLVYSLIKKGKNSGRITGMVLCILGILAALPGALSILFSPMPWGLIFTLIYLAAVIVNIFWLIRASHRDVKANLV